MAERQKASAHIEAMVLVACRRRCCLCAFLGGDDSPRKGQIAHLNQDRSDNRFENLVWLCFEHHDEYDSKTSQSKGLTKKEVKFYRDKLHKRYPSHEESADERKILVSLGEQGKDDEYGYVTVCQEPSNSLEYLNDPWRFPLWQTANTPELFAYKAGNRSDGICLIERVHIPDGRIVVAAIAIAGNPGNSITNCVEELCLQVCQRFQLPSNRLVWLEHYDTYDAEWNHVTFRQMPPVGPFEDPKWTQMNSEAWRKLRLKPKRRLIRRRTHYDSKLKKLFHWPDSALDD